MPTAYASVYQTYVLSYNVPTGTVTTDAAGNETQVSAARTVEAYLETPRAPNVQAQIGADTVRVDYEGALTDPPNPPADFVTGTIVTFLMDGRTVTGRVRVFAPDPIPQIDLVEGRRLQVNANG